MPPRIEIKGVPPYDGTYPLDPSFTVREWHVIKELSGVRPGEWVDAIQNVDLDLAVALAVNALRRAGHTVDIDALMDSEAGRIRVIGDGVDDAVPPLEPSSPSDGKPSEQTGSSGASSSTTGDPSESGPSPTGTQD